MKTTVIFISTAILLIVSSIGLAQSKKPHHGQSVEKDSVVVRMPLGDSLARGNVGQDSPGSVIDSTAHRQQDYAKAATDTAKTSQSTISLPPGATETTTLSFKDTDIRDIFRGLAYQHGLNIFVDNSINKRTTISLNKVRVYDAIVFLCEQNNLNLVLDDGIFKISEIPTPKVIPPPPHVPYVAYNNGHLWIDADNDNLATVVDEIEKKASKNILIMSGTQGTISGALSDIDFDIGFTQIMNNNGLAVERRQGVYLISQLNYFVGNGTQTKTSGPYWISVKDSLVTVDVTEAPVQRIISDLVHQVNADAVFYDPVPGTITARVTSVSMRQALDILLMNTKSTYRFSDGKYFIGDKTDKTMNETRLFELKYMRPDRVIEMTPQSISSQAMIKPVKEHNGVVIMSTSDIISQFDEFVQAIDKPVPQVLIEAIVVDYNLTKGSAFGINAGIQNAADTNKANSTFFPGLDYTVNGSALNYTLKQQTGNINLFGKNIGIANLGVLPANFYLNLQALESKGVADVRSRPLLATLNGYPASLSIGKTQYYLLSTSIPYNGQGNQTVFQTSTNFQTIQADVKLEITPYIGADGMIFVDIKPDFKTPEGTLSSSSYPTIDERSMSSTIEMREGETIVLGGMISNTTSVSKTSTPLLGDIPILGELFSSTTRSNEKQELIIYITPHISYGREFQNVYLPEQEK